MANNDQRAVAALTASIAEAYSAFPQVEAVVLGGSQTSGFADPSSDLDLYVYVQQPLTLAERARVPADRASYAEVGNDVWEPGDEWRERDSQRKIDVMFREVPWIEAQLDRVLQQQQASVGYTTCIWHNVRSSQPIYDRTGWFSALQEKARQPYPEALRQAIVAKNHPILRQTLSSYRQQVERAIQRNDLVSVQHRVAALLASYFDILFAINRLPHPGEKRLITIAVQQCQNRPDAMTEQVHALIRTLSINDEAVLARIDELVDGLDRVLAAEGLIPAPTTR